MINNLIKKVIDSDISFPNLVKEINAYNKEKHSYERNVRIAVIGSSSVQYIVSILKFNLNLRGYNVEIFESPYDGINSCLLHMDEELIKFAPQFALILPHYTDIKEFPPIFCVNDEYDNYINDVVGRQKLIWDNLGLISNIHVFQFNYVVPYIELLGAYEGNTFNSRSNFIREINRRMLLEKPSFTTLIDLDAYASQVGKCNWFDYPSYFATKTGFSMKYILPVTNKIARLITAIHGKPRKCLILDLDNTLWGDVVGEVGTLGVILDPNDPEGESYRFFQSYIKGLKERGVILAVCSKNDENVAKEVFTSNPNMILKLDDISCFIANWDNKATNIDRIAQTLNIGLDSLVFVDDNAAEREIIRQNLPQVLVIDLPEDVDGYVPTLYNSGAFDWAEITEEDILRSNTYVANAKRDELRKNFIDYDSYLESLEMKAQILQVDDTNCERFVQLINKSNQFNLTTRRTTEKMVNEMINTTNCTLLAVHLTDRFSYYGNIACLILRQEGVDLRIDTYVMSCRVLKRGLEDTILHYIVGLAKEKGCLGIIGEYIPTDRNGMVKFLYDNYGFDLLLEKDEYKKYRLDVRNYHQSNKSFIKLID